MQGIHYDGSDTNRQYISALYYKFKVFPRYSIELVAFGKPWTRQTETVPTPQASGSSCPGISRLDNARALGRIWGPEACLCGAYRRGKVEMEEGRVLRYDGRPILLEALLDRLNVGSLRRVTDLRPPSSVGNDRRNFGGRAGRGGPNAETACDESSTDPRREDGGEVELRNDEMSEPGPFCGFGMETHFDILVCPTLDLCSRVDQRLHAGSVYVRSISRS